MRHVQVLSKIYRDNSGHYISLATILLEINGNITTLEPLLKYQISNHYKSRSWHIKLLQAVGLLLDYMDANQDINVSAKEYFSIFVERLYTGTINEFGEDPSGLYWLPKKHTTANMLLSQLNMFSDWLSEEYNTEPLNPWRTATKYEERLKWMALINAKHNSFLGHLKSVHDISETAKLARNMTRRRPPYISGSIIKAFPEEKIMDLIFIGFRKAHKNINNISLIDQYNWRDMAITILMHGGGLRHSEVFHLWMCDVIPNPNDVNTAIVRIYHPCEGEAPKDFKSPTTGKYVSDRESYLLLKYGLLPRNKYPANDKRFAGWKNPLLDNSQGKYLHVYWYPKKWGYIFMFVWKMYMAQRLKEHIPVLNPYAFVSHAPLYKGEMLSPRVEREQHDKAVTKIGLPVGKNYGTTLHGHRHAYGQRLENSLPEGNDKKLVIRKALHHKSEKSQEIYTAPNAIKISSIMDQAETFLSDGQAIPMNFDFETWFTEKYYNYGYEKRKWRK